MSSTPSYFQWTSSDFLFSYSAITVSNSSVPLYFLHFMRCEGSGSACPWFSCCAGCVFELLSGWVLWWTGSAWLCFMWTVLGCVSAGGVVGPVSHYFSCRNHILSKADFIKCTVNIWSLSHSYFGQKQGILKMLFLITYNNISILLLCPSPDMYWCYLTVEGGSDPFLQHS